MKTFDEIFSEIKRRCDSYDPEQKRAELKEKLSRRRIVLFGAGMFCDSIYTALKEYGMDAECVCDNYKKGADPKTGLKIITPAALRETLLDANVVITAASVEPHEEIHEQLISMGFVRDRIFSFNQAMEFVNQVHVAITRMSLTKFLTYKEGHKRAYDFFRDDLSRRILIGRINSYLFNDSMSEYAVPNEYFPDEFKFSDDEVFVDGGLYNGDTVRLFIDKVGGKYNRIFGFDIDENNITEARENLSMFSNVEIVNKGLWNHEETVKANLRARAGSGVNPEGSDRADMVSLDEFLVAYGDTRVTYIKLDIEGAEYSALMGARKTIADCAPALAVCVYHQPQDVYELLELINGINPQYSFMLRHHLPSCNFDTVLYCYQDKSF
ncbi:hypothetical protein FACS1894216_18370 [Synergistales bacterium]|nr:hypothetical protein FACS1894216_18370 [Synergistales bacterium]